MKSIVLFVGIFIASSAPSHAARLSIADAVSKAVESNLGLAEAREKARQAAHDKYRVRAILLPDVSMTATSTWRKDAVAGRTASSVAFGGNSYNSYDVGLKAEQSLFTYGSVSAISKAELAREASDIEAEKIGRDLTKNVIASYYKVVLKQHQVRLLEGEQAAIGEILQTAQNRLRLGGKKIDVLQVRTQQALVKPKIERARNDLASAAAELAELTNSRDSFELGTQMPSLEIKNIESKLNLKNFRLPELESLRLQREQIDHEKSVSLGSHLPKLKAIGQYNFSNYTKSELFDPGSNSWSLQLQLSVPIFSGFSAIYDRRSLESRDAQLAFKESDTAKQLQLIQLKSRKSLESAEASLASAAEAARLASESMKEAKRDYRFGILDFLQYLQVQQAEFEANTSLAQLQYDALLSYADYFVASGQPLEILVHQLESEGGSK